MQGPGKLPFLETGAASPPAIPILFLVLAWPLFLALAPTVAVSIEMAKLELFGKTNGQLYGILGLSRHLLSLFSNLPRAFYWGISRIIFGRRSLLGFWRFGALGGFWAFGFWLPALV